MATEDTGNQTTAEIVDDGQTLESWVQDLQQKASVGTAREGQQGAAPAAGEQPPPPPAQQEPPAPKKPPASLAHEKFRERQQRREQAREGTELDTLRRQNAELLDTIREAMGGGDPQQRPGAAPQQRAAGEDAEPDYYGNPKAWHEWNRREMERQVAKKIDPLVAERQAQERAAQQQSQQMAVRDRLAAELKQAEDDYLQTEEGEGFHDRVNAYPDLYSFALQELAGFPEGVAKGLVGAHMRDVVRVAAQHGLNPAATMDRIIGTHELIAEVMRAMRSGGQPPAAAGAPAQRASAAPPQHAQDALAAMNAAARAPEAHSLGAQNSTSPASGDDLKSLARSGQLNPKLLAAGLARRGYNGSTMKAGIFDFLADIEGGG